MFQKNHSNSRRKIIQGHRITSETDISKIYPRAFVSKCKLIAKMLKILYVLVFFSFVLSFIFIIDIHYFGEPGWLNQ